MRTTPITRTDYPDACQPGDEVGWIIVRDDMPPTDDKVAQGQGFMAGPYRTEQTAIDLIEAYAWGIAHAEQVRIES